jgi:hypothetical protein
VRQLEERTVPSVFNIPNHDVAALIRAIHAANADGTADTINLAQSGSYQFTGADNNTHGNNALPVITSHNLTMNGDNASLLGPGIGQVQARLLNIGAGANVVLENVKLAGGVARGLTDAQGGGIYNAGANLTLKSVSVSGNGAEWTNGNSSIPTFEGAGMSRTALGGGSGGSAQGGGIYSTGGHLTLIGSQVSFNFAAGGNAGITPVGGVGGNGGRGSGAGLYLQGGRATLSNCVVSVDFAYGGQGGATLGGKGGRGGDATGGGIYSNLASVVLYQCKIESAVLFPGNGGAANGRPGVTATAPGRPGGAGSAAGVGGAGGNAAGAGVYVNGGSLAMLGGLLHANSAYGGAGGFANASHGANGAAGSSHGGSHKNGGHGGNAGAGGRGGAGGSADGVGLFSAGGTLTFSNVTVDANRAVGGGGGLANGGGNLGTAFNHIGGGGKGGNGTAPGSAGGNGGPGGNGGNGGHGGNGGPAVGGGIYVAAGALGLTQSTVTNNTLAGSGGGAASGGQGGVGGNGGNGGPNAAGGRGGDGHSGGSGGSGGNGGNEQGGGLFLGGNSSAILTQTTPQGNNAFATLGGLAGAGAGGNGGFGGQGSPTGAGGAGGRTGRQGTRGQDGTVQGTDVQGTTTAGTAFSASGNTVTNVFPNIPTGWVLLATFSGGPSEPSASAYRAFVAWGDGTTSYSAAPNASVAIVLAGGNIEVIARHTYAAGGSHSATVALWVPGNVSAQATATIDVARNVTSQVAITKGTPTFNPSTHLFSDTITVTNATQGSDIAGSLDLLVSGLPAGVTLADASITVGGTKYNLAIDYTSTGMPYIHVPTAVVADLEAGQSLTFHVDFSSPSAAKIQFGNRLFSDPFDT